MSFLEISDFHCIYLTKPKCTPYLKFMQTFIKNWDDMTLSRVFFWLVKYQFFNKNEVS